MVETADTLDATFGPDTITLSAYPFFERNRGRVLCADELTETPVGWAPPCIRTSDGEFIYISAAKLEPLIAFCTAHDIPFLRRVDVWSMILDPFLDTTLDEDYLESSRRILDENGVPEEEVERMRRLVGTRMRLLTRRTFEWVYYGLFDVLRQMSALTFTTGWTFERFYEHATELANRGAVSPATAAELRHLFTPDADPLF